MVIIIYYDYLTEHDKYMSAFVECSKLDVLILTMIKVPILYIAWS